jgi:hypothetical protein
VIASSSKSFLNGFPAYVHVSTLNVYKGSDGFIMNMKMKRRVLSLDLTQR